MVAPFMAHSTATWPMYPILAICLIALLLPFCGVALGVSALVFGGRADRRVIHHAVIGIAVSGVVSIVEIYLVILAASLARGLP